MGREGQSTSLLGVGRIHPGTTRAWTKQGSLCLYSHALRYRDFLNYREGVCETQFNWNSVVKLGMYVISSRNPQHDARKRHLQGSVGDGGKLEATSVDLS